ncbi:MAG TPA: hypothetical protein VE961_12380 [Pyrinomonadaceae bacterium]|nr:hypothetical protein [Pyrinomonadaceae bacterium]
MKKLFGLLVIGMALVPTAYAVVPDQPFMEAALSDLSKAKVELASAMRNKGGHRATAASLTQQAIDQVKAGIAFAKRHNHGTLAAPDQPHMQAALDALKSARQNLDKAEADKGGHRAKAIELVNHAIDEVNAGIQAAEGGR